MNYRVLSFLLFSILLITSACKKNKSNGGAVTDSVREDVQQLYSLHQSIAAQFESSLDGYNISDFDVDLHAEDILVWIKNQPNVAEAEMQALDLFWIKHTNGLESTMIFRPKPTKASEIGRGAASTGAALTKFPLGELPLLKSAKDDKLIKNKKALIILAHSSDFYAPYCTLSDAKNIQDVVELLEYADIDLEVDIKVDQGLAAFHNIDDYGFILIETHGSRDGSFSSGEEVFDKNLLAGSNPPLTNAITSIAEDVRKNHVIVTTFWDYDLNKAVEISSASWTLTPAFVAKQNWDFDDAVWLGNYCYSGANFGVMADAFKTKGLKTFYGYGWAHGPSHEITNGMAWRTEDTIIRSLFYDVDTTGIAHLEKGVNEITDTLLWNKIPQRIKDRYWTPKFVTSAQPMRHFLDPGYRFDDCDTALIDSRDNKEYKIVCIGEQVWMAENLNWQGAGSCFDGNPQNCKTYGRWYTQVELTGGTYSDSNPSGVQGICPKGWHVPSIAEWQEMLTTIGGATSAGGKLRDSSSLWDTDPGTDDFGFAALPAGECSIDLSTSTYDCFNMGDDANFWTSSSSTGGYGEYILIQGIDYVSQLSAPQDSKFSCRCLKDK